MANSINMAGNERIRLDALYRATGIKRRYSVLPDFGLKAGQYVFFPNNPDLQSFPGTGARMQIYRKEALKLACKALEDCFRQIPENIIQGITHVITVSCTGMYAPGLDIEIAEYLNLPGTTSRTAINFMGCYAAFNALKTADAFCRSDPEATVLIVSVELCTIHYQNSSEWDHILSNAIFGDGAAACLITSSPLTDKAFQLQGFFCDLEPKGKEEMTWGIGDFGFEMTLSSYVPELIKGGIKHLIKRLLHTFSSANTQIDLYAIHPGGKRILEVIEEELSLDKKQNHYAYSVLENYGNMSSATILFVLKELLNDLSGQDNSKNVLSVAFGPGLTLESMLLKPCIRNKPGYPIEFLISESVEKV